MRQGQVQDPPARTRAAADVVLREAARRAAATWHGLAGGPDEGETAELLGLLVEAVERRLGGGGGEADRRLASATGRRLLHVFRTALVRGWADGGLPSPGSAEGVAVLAALEDVYSGLEPDWTRDLGPFPGPGFELFVDIAHDLRSPLNSILFLAETLQRGSSGAVTDLQRRQLGLIYSAALGLNNLASDALELALDRDRLVEKDPAPFSVTEVLEAVRSIVYPVAEEKGLELRLHAPPTDHRLGQPVALGRVLLNLTTNALKFTDEGYVEIRAADLGDDRLEFSVRDTGPGVNPDAIPSLFQPFRRARARSGVFFSGTGLGLAISRKLVRAMGADLQLETRSDWGTRFYFELTLPTV